MNATLVNNSPVLHKCTFCKYPQNKTIHNNHIKTYIIIYPILRGKEQKLHIINTSYAIEESDLRVILRQVTLDTFRYEENIQSLQLYFLQTQKERALD